MEKKTLLVMDRPILKAKSRIQPVKSVKKTAEAKSILKNDYVVTLKRKTAETSLEKKQSSSNCDIKDKSIHAVQNAPSASKPLSNFRIPKLKCTEKKRKISEDEVDLLPSATTRSHLKSSSSQEEKKCNSKSSSPVKEHSQNPQSPKRSPTSLVQMSEFEAARIARNRSRRGRNKKNPVESSSGLKTNDFPFRLPKSPNVENNQKKDTDSNKIPPFVGLPIPDYEDVAEDMEWESQIPEIRRLWEENEIAPTVYPEKPKVNNVEDEDMEVDPSELLIIVPDTNIWIGCVNLLKQLLETFFPKVGCPIIVIPWMVLQELDVNSKIPRCNPARNSVKFIHELLSSRHPRVKGQKASDAALSQLKFDEVTADDSILQCAFQLQKNETTVVFLSNDRNLCNKALVHGLLTFDSHNAVSKIFDIFLNTRQNPPTFSNPLISENSNATLSHSTMSNTYNNQHGDFNANIKNTPDDKFGMDGNKMFNQLRNNGLGMSSLSKNSTDAPVTKVFSLTTNSELNESKHFNEVLKTLRTAISFIIEDKMKEDYGEDWLDTVKIKPPWTLPSAVKCLIEHWIAVFSFVFSPRGKANAEQLFRTIKDYESLSGSKVEQQNEIVEAALGLFNLGKGSLMKDPQVENCRQVLLNFVMSNRK